MRQIIPAKSEAWARLLAAIALAALCLPMWGQQADSLYRVFVKADKAGRIEVANSLSKMLKEADVTDTLYLCDDNTPDDMVNIQMHYLMGEYYFDLEEYNETMDQVNIAYKLVEKKKASKLKSDVLGLLSNTQLRTGKIDAAFKTLMQAYKVDKELGDQRLISSDLNSLAAIYLTIEQPQPGIRFIEKAIDIERKLKRSDRLAIRLGMASELYRMNKEPDKAMDAIKEAIDIEVEAGRTEKAAIRQSQLGGLLMDMGQDTEARQAILAAIPVLEQVQNHYSLAVCYNQMGEIEQKRGDRQAAVDYYKKALELSIKCGTPSNERDAEYGLWVNMREDNPAIAMIHLERYTALSDSLHSKMADIQSKVIDATIEDLEPSGTKTGYLQSRKAIVIGSILMGLLLALAFAVLFIAWKRSRATLQMQRQTQTLRSHFFSNISNELQTPLTVILSAGRQLLETNKTSPEENRIIGEMIVNHGNNMLGLVNQLIENEQVKAQVETSELKQGDIVMFVRMLVENHTDSARKRLINLQFQSPLKTLMMVFAPEYIRRIVHLLVNNALRYTSRNGSVTVSIQPLEANKMRLMVSDTGKGIPVEERKRLFEPFNQRMNVDEGVKSSVDLAIVKQLVDAMQGTITVESELDKGTTFTIDFPNQQVNGLENLPVLLEPSKYAETRLSQPNDMKGKPLIFIVENNEDVAFFIASHLTKDYNLRFARDGREAFQNAQDLVPNLIITNLVMPVMDGKELIRKLRADGSLNHIPIIALTSDTSEEERFSCIETGADAVLVKPFNSTELRLLAKHFINRQAVLRERYSKTNPATGNENDSKRLSKEDQEFINHLIDVVHAQMAKDDIDMEHIAAALSLSRKQLRTRVMAITGLTPVAYVLQLRLNYARRMMLTQSLSLTAIASKCGFQNLSHFSKAFKQQFGVNPQQFRKNFENFNQT